MLKVWCGIILGMSLSGCSGDVSGGSETADLTGTWYVTGQDGDDTRALIVTLSKDQLEIRDLSATIAAQRSGDKFNVETTEGRRRGRLTATQTGGGLMKTGALPLDPSGHWALLDAEDASYGCSMIVTKEKVTGSCNRAPIFGLFSLSRGELDGTRTKTLSSIFGELGGEWTLNSKRSSCTLKLEGSSVTLNCSPNSDSFYGRTEINFQGDRISGRTSTGIEFAAERR